MIQKDITVIGGGPGGYVAAIHAAHLGASVALIEKDILGGTCINRGCIPTKTLVRSADLLRDTLNSHDFGIEAENIIFNLNRAVERKDEIVNRMVANLKQLMKINRISVYRGIGRITSSSRVEIEGEEIDTRSIIIATGSQHTPLPVPGANLPGVLSTDEVLELKEMPKSMVVIGGSYVGTEFATIFNTFGTSVSIVKRRPLRLEPVDEEIGRRFSQVIISQGIKVITGATVKEIRQANDALQVVWDAQEGEQTIAAQKVLMATGRRPYTADLGLEELGVIMNSGAITVNEFLETNVKGVYAIGDVLGTNMLAHVASHEGIVAVENALGGSRSMDYRAVPSCIFTSPVVACVGMAEKDAQEKGIPYRVSKFPFSASGRAMAMGETSGLIKLIVNAEDGKVLGMHMFGPNADDLIAEGALAVQLGATAEDIANTMHAHPTLPEAVYEAAMGCLNGSIHYGRIR